MCKWYMLSGLNESKGSNEAEYWQEYTIIGRLDSGGHFFFSFSFFLYLSFPSSMRESSVLFKLSTSSKTGWKYSRRLNKGAGGRASFSIRNMPKIVFKDGKPRTPNVALLR